MRQNIVHRNQKVVNDLFYGLLPPTGNLLVRWSAVALLGAAAGALQPNLAEGAPVPSWLTVAGANGFVQATSNLQPTVVTDSAGRPKVRFSSLTRLATAYAPPAAGNVRTLVLIGSNFVSNAALQHLLGYGDFNTDLLGFGLTHDALDFLGYDGGGVVNGATATLADRNPHITILSYDGGDLVFRADNNAVTVPAMLNTSVSALTLGNAGGTAFDAYEVLIYGSAITVQQVAEIKEWAAISYGTPLPLA